MKFICFLILLLCANASWARPLPTIRKDALTVGIRMANTPFGNNSTPAGKGFEHDLVAEISKELKAPRFRIVVVNSLGEGFDKLEKRRLDLFLSTIKPDPQIEKRFVFTQPYYKTNLAIATLASNNQIFSLSDLNSHYIAYTPETKAGIIAQRFLPKSKVEVVPEINLGLELLLKKEVTAVLHDRAVLEWVALNNKSIAVLPNNLSDETYVILSDKKSSPLVEEVNRILKKLLEAPSENQSRMAQLLAKYQLPMTLPETIIAAPSSTASKPVSKNATPKGSPEERLNKALSLIEQLRMELESLRKEIK